jgi:hypothetical protein
MPSSSLPGVHVKASLVKAAPHHPDPPLPNAWERREKTPLATPARRGEGSWEGVESRCVFLQNKLYGPGCSTEAYRSEIQTAASLPFSQAWEKGRRTDVRRDEGGPGVLPADGPSGINNRELPLGWGRDENAVV